jgi:hypothetical protein
LAGNILELGGGSVPDILACVVVEEPPKISEKECLMDSSRMFSTQITSKLLLNIPFYT